MYKQFLKRENQVDIGHKFCSIVHIPVKKKAYSTIT